jgi:hypothetical protein
MVAVLLVDHRRSASAHAEGAGGEFAKPAPRVSVVGAREG